MFRPLVLSLVGVLSLPAVAATGQDSPTGASAQAPAVESDPGQDSQPPASPESRPAPGTVIASESGWVEFLPDAPPAGTTLHLPEGWIRVDSVPEGEEPGGGSFGVISAEVLAGLAPEQAVSSRRRSATSRAQDIRPPTEEGGAGSGTDDSAGMGHDQSNDWEAAEPYGQAAADQGPGPCYAEQEAYAKELFRIAGIEEIDHPLALLQALGETPGLSPWVRFNLFGSPLLGPTVSWIDPVRPLAWDDALRWAAEDLTACTRRQLGFDDRLVDPDLTR